MKKKFSKVMKVQISAKNVRNEILSLTSYIDAYTGLVQDVC
jgi:hypothetical protein